MQSKLHGYVVHHGVELATVACFYAFLLTIPNSLLILKELLYTSIRESESTLYVGMVQGVSNSQYIGIGTKSRKAPKNAQTTLSRVKY